MIFLQIIELPNHPYFIGAQFHPEFKSRPGKPSALFLGMRMVFTLLEFVPFDSCVKYLSSKHTHIYIYIDDDDEQWMQD